MGKSDQSVKITIKSDGEELKGLVEISEYEIEDAGSVDVPGRDKTVTVRSGNKKVPPIEAVFKRTKDSSTIEYLENWFYKFEEHEVTLIRSDGAGREFARELWQNVEVDRCSPGGYNAGQPDYAKVKVRFLPEDIIPMKAG